MCTGFCCDTAWAKDMHLYREIKVYRTPAILGILHYNCNTKNLKTCLSVPWFIYHVMLKHVTSRHIDENLIR